MTNSELFRTRNFLPIFIAQFCSCLNDSLIKSALIIYVTYKIDSAFGLSSALLVLLLQAIFISPFVIFASIAGELADKYEKTQIIRLIKVSEIVIVILSAYGFYHKSISLLFLNIFLLGVHSTFFGPIKYSILPEHLPKEALLNANGLIEAATFVGICAGSILGGLYNYYSNFVIFSGIILSIIGFVSSLFIPKTNSGDLNLKINYNLWSGNLNLVKYCLDKKILLISILGNSWFWFIGSCFISQIPLFAKITFSGDETVTNLFLIIFSLGVGVGSGVCNLLYKGDISTKYVYISAIGMTIFSLDLAYTSSGIVANENLISISGFLGDIYNIRILFDMFCFSALSGIYVVPFYALMQFYSENHFRSRVIAANNVINSIFIVGSAIFLAILFALHFSIPKIIMILGIINFLVAIIIYRITPDSMKITKGILRVILKVIFNKIYKVEVKGLDNFYNAGKKVVIIANHVSLIDGVLLAVYLPDEVFFAVNSIVVKKWWAKLITSITKTYTIDTHSPFSIKNLIEEVKNNQKLVIFPEGRVTNTGSLMKIYEGPAIIADKSDAVILPIHINGLQYTHFSHAPKSNSGIKVKFFPKVTISILPHIKINDSKANNKERRKLMGTKIYDIMCKMALDSIDREKHLYLVMLEAAKFHRYKDILEDINYTPLNYRQFIIRTIIVSRLLENNLKQLNIFPDFQSNSEKAKANINNGSQGKFIDQYRIVGLMLPTSIGCTVMFYSMQLANLVPAMINFSLGYDSIVKSCNLLNIKIIYTSRKFIEQVNLQNLIENLQTKFKVQLVEDFKPSILDKAVGLFNSFIIKEYFEHVNKHNATSAAVILFTSGTEGNPKAVALSHKNIYTNICQMISHFDFNSRDIAFNCLPLFHSFGLLVKILMLTRGIKSFLYPSPLHYKVIPEFFYESNCTILIGTDTFLNMYYKTAHPYDFYSARYVVAGAEKLKESTRKLWLEKFGIRILEGYGATECSPVISVNNNMYYKSGSVGRIITGMEYKLVSVEDIKDGYKLLVKGDNVMLGYVKDGELEPLIDDWYDTGDVVKIDEEGYIHIIARLKRFAKIGGEMISLPKIEEVIQNLSSNHTHAVVAVRDEVGEKIVLFTTNSLLKISGIVEYLDKIGLSALFVPKEIIFIEEMLVFPNGKINYNGLIKKYK